MPLPKLSSYELKIQELTEQIRLKAIELGKKQEEVEVEGKKKRDIIESLTKHYAELQDARAELTRTRKEIHNTGKKRQADLAQYDTEILNKKRNLLWLESQKSSLAGEIKRMEIAQKEKKALEKEITLIGKTIKELGNEKNKLSKEILLIEGNRESEERKIEQMKEKAEEIYRSIDMAIKETKDYQKMAKPYINAIVRWCVMHKEKPPELLHDYKPKNIAYPQWVHKKILK
jgi:chromosome segregation ATPase